MPQQNNKEIIGEDTEKKVQDKTPAIEKDIVETAVVTAQQTEVSEKISLLERMKAHPSVFVRGLSHVLFSIWITTIIIGSFLAWIISLLFI